MYSAVTMFSRFVVLSVLLALTIAQNTTTSLFIYGGIFPNPEYRQPPLLASVIGSVSASPTPQFTKVLNLTYHTETSHHHLRFELQLR